MRQQSSGQRPGDGNEDGADHVGVDQLPVRWVQARTQQEIADRRPGQESQPVGHSQVAGHQIRVVGQVRRRQRCRDLHRRDDDDQQDRRPRLLTGVEDAKLQQHQRVRDEGERRQGDRQAEVAGVDRTEVAVGEQCAADRRPGDGHQRDDRDQCHHRQPGGQRQVGEDGRQIVGRGVAGQPRHHHGQHGDADDAERQHQYQPGVVVDRGPGRRCAAGDLVADDQSDLADQHVQHHRQRHHPEPLEPLVDAPQRAQADLLAADRDEQHGGLGDHAEGGADAQDQQLGVAHLHRIDREFSGHKDIQSQRQYGDDVVDHRGPRRGAEHVAGVQDRHEHRRETVEDDLRQQEKRESCGQRPVHQGIGAQHQIHQQWCGQRRDDGDDQ